MQNSNNGNQRGLPVWVMPLLIGFMTGLLVGGLPNACQSRDTEREKTEVRREMEAMHGDALAREAASSVEAAKEKDGK